MAMSLEVIPTILELVRAGTKLIDIAREYGVTKQALSQYLTAHAEPEYRHAQEEALERVVADMKAAISAAQTRDEISKAREIARVEMWNLERRYPHLYGNRQIIQGDKDSDPVQISVIDYKTDE